MVGVMVGVPTTVVGTVVGVPTTVVGAVVGVRAHRAFGNAPSGQRSSPAPRPTTLHTGSPGPC